MPLSQRIHLVNGVQGDESKLRFIAVTQTNPARKDWENPTDWLRENVQLILAPGEQREDVSEHSSVLDIIEEQQGRLFIVAGGYIYSDNVYNEIKPPRLPEAEGPRVIVPGSESLTNKRSLGQSGYAVEFYLVGKSDQQVKQVIEEKYAEFLQNLPQED